MVNKCAVYGCERGYERKTKTKEDYHVFHFPFTKKPELLPVWERFVNRSNWKTSTNSVICDLHFEENLINNRTTRWTLKWDLNPVLRYLLRKC